MIAIGTVLTVILAYKTVKKYAAEEMDRPKAALKHKNHMHAFVIIGQGLFILGQSFLLTADSIILNPDWLLFLVLFAIIVTDIQDVVFRKYFSWLYAVVATEFVLWSTLALVAFMSAQFGIGVLLFVSSLSRIADMYLLMQAEIASKRA